MTALSAQRRPLPRIELIFDDECPHVEEVRVLLRTALARAGVPERWKEWVRQDAATPAGLRRFASPTVLVNGRDVDNEQSIHSRAVPPPLGACRLYWHGDRLCGVPPFAALADALRLKK